MTQSLPIGVQVTGAISPAVEEVLTSDALDFLAGRPANGRLPPLPKTSTTAVSKSQAQQSAR